MQNERPRFTLKVHKERMGRWSAQLFITATAEDRGIFYGTTKKKAKAAAAKEAKRILEAGDLD